MAEKMSQEQIDKKHREIYNKACEAKERGDLTDFEKIKKEELYPFREKYGIHIDFSQNQNRKEEKLPSGQPAPILKWHDDKWNYAGSYDKDIRPKGKYFYQLPVPLMKYIWNNLNGKNGLKCRIMEVLIGTREGFGISEKWICETIGIGATNKNAMASYRKARKELCEMGWLEYDSNTHELFVCYDFLWEQALLKEDDYFRVFKNLIL